MIFRGVKLQIVVLIRLISQISEIPCWNKWLTSAECRISLFFLRQQGGSLRPSLRFLHLFLYLSIADITVEAFDFLFPGRLQLLEILRWTFDVFCSFGKAAGCRWLRNLISGHKRCRHHESKLFVLIGSWKMWICTVSDGALIRSLRVISDSACRTRLISLRYVLICFDFCFEILSTKMWYVQCACERGKRARERRVGETDPDGCYFWFMGKHFSFLPSCKEPYYKWTNPKYSDNIAE